MAEWNDKISLILEDIPSKTLLKLLCVLYDPETKKLNCSLYENDEAFWKNVYITFVSKNYNGKKLYKTKVLQVIDIIYSCVCRSNFEELLMIASNREWTIMITFVWLHWKHNMHSALRLAIREKKCKSALTIIELDETLLDYGILKYCVTQANNDILEKLIDRFPVGRVEPPIESVIITAITHNSSSLNVLFRYEFIKMFSTGRIELLEAVKRGLSDHIPTLISNLDHDTMEEYDTILTECLMNATEAGNDDIVELLLCEGARIDAIGCAKQTPLHRAAMFCKSSTMEILVRHPSKKDLNQCDYYGHSPLSLVLCSNGVLFLHKKERTCMARTLIQAGAEVTETNIVFIATRMPSLLTEIKNINSYGKETGDTILHLAVGSTTLNTSDLKQLLSIGLSVTARNKNGDTALHVLAEYVTDDNVRASEQDIIEELISSGARLDALNKQGKIPAQLCRVDWIATLLLPDDMKKRAYDMSEKSAVLNAMKHLFVVDNNRKLMGHRS